MSTNDDSTHSDSAQADRPASIDLSGRRLGDYQMLRRIGRGAMAEVYLAEQLSLSRRVAFKVLKSDLAKDPTYVRRFEREARAAASLSHANIVQIFEVGQCDDFQFISQEYVDGVNLKQWIARNGSLDPHTGLLVMWQVASALAKAAEAGIVHRDIKPENILLARDGTVKVADFGLARVSTAEGVDLTQIGITLGTPLYMSPEQVEGLKIDPRSDIYSLGVTCYHMFAGRPPFSGDTPLSVAVQHLRRQPQPLENECPNLPPALCRIIHRMMEKAPGDRYETPRQLLRELAFVRKTYFSDDDWPEHLTPPSSESSTAIASGIPLSEMDSVEIDIVSNVDVTQHLTTLMKDESARRSHKKGILLVALASLLAFAIGLAFAWMSHNRMSDTSDKVSVTDLVPRQQTAGQQVMYAARLGTDIPAWQAVIEYYPDQNNGYWALYAKHKLAQLYVSMTNQDREKSGIDGRKLFTELAQTKDSPGQLRAFGLVGQCLMQENDSHANIERLKELWELRQFVENDPQMLGFLSLIIEKTGNEVGSNAELKRWNDWLESLTQPS